MEMHEVEDVPVFCLKTLGVAKELSSVYVYLLRLT